MADTPITSKTCVYKEYDSKEDVNKNNVGYSIKEQAIKHLMKSK
ncbi:hypothetical protein [Bacteroides fragilis]|nr:hypothetical protein [Bacteroides fragilis]